MKEYDAVIIGAGPAGLASAFFLGREGLRLALVDRQTFPIDKPCGEGVMPPGVKLLKEMGVTANLAREHYQPFQGIQYQTETGRRAQGTFAEGEGWGIRRLHLSEALGKTLVASGAQVDVFAECAVTGVSREGDRMKVDMAGGESLSAKVVIGADGLRSRVRKWAGLEKPMAKGKRLGIRQHFACRPWSDWVEVYPQGGKELYITPCGPEQIGVACLWDGNRVETPRPGTKAFRQLFADFPEIRDRVGDAPEASEVQSRGPLEQRTRGRVAPGVMLVGDSGGYLDACTGEGITLTLKQAKLAGEMVGPALREARSGPELEVAMDRWERACRSLMRSYYFGTRFQMLLQQRPALVEQYVSLLGKRPALFQHLLSFNHGTTGLIPPMKRWREVALG
ncbi:MAG: NAD(P)/FAD-dependent oxidoreductase [Verrucomicrobiota bacterium]